MIEQVLHHLLTTDAAVTAIVAGRVHYAERPQAYPLPALVIQRGARERLQTLKGPTSTETGIVRVTALAANYLQASDLAAAAADALDGKSGAQAVKDAAGADAAVPLKYLTLDNQYDLPSDHRDGQGQIATHGVTADFRYAITISYPLED